MGRWGCGAGGVIALPAPPATGRRSRQRSEPASRRETAAERAPVGSICSAPCCPAPGRTVVGAGGTQPGPTGALGGQSSTRRCDAGQGGGSCGDLQAGSSGSRVAFEYGNLWC